MTRWLHFICLLKMIFTVHGQPHPTTPNLSGHNYLKYNAFLLWLYMILIVIMIMIKIQGRGTACLPDQLQKMHYETYAKVNFKSVQKLIDLALLRINCSNH